MKTPLPPKPRSYTSRRIARFARYFSGICLTTIGLVLAASTTYALINHPPTISWIRDQALKSGTQFAQVYFRAWDNETTLGITNLTYLVENAPESPSFYTGSIQVNRCRGSDSGCPTDGTGYKLTFDPIVNGNGAATIKITATDGGSLTAATSFTLRKQSSVINPPVIAGIPNETIQSTSSAGYGPVWFVVGDLDTSGKDDVADPNGSSQLDFTWSSDNTQLVPLPNIIIQPAGGMGGRAFTVTVFPAPNQTGRAVITISATDLEGFATSTSFVLDVIASTNTPPSFTPDIDATYKEQDVTQSATTVYNFKVTDAQITNKSNLLVTATSSNGSLVPNDAAHLAISTIASNGVGTLTIRPLALPPPAPGVPQASTITLSVTDEAYTRRMQFLYVAKDSTFGPGRINRPAGVYNLDPKRPSSQRPNDMFLTGEMHRISWRQIDNGNPNPDNWDWIELNDAVANLRNGQDLSLNLIEEPCDIVADPRLLEFQPWCDTDAPKGQLECTNTPCTRDGKPGVKRAVPWDDYLRERRNTFLRGLAQHVIPATGRTVAQEPLISIINPNLPGGDTGIRELDGEKFSADLFDGYTRAELLGAVKAELDTVLLNFPRKLVHIGFFTVEDVLGGEPLWQYLYPRLRDRYNGVIRPRVHFFQEDLAAARASAAPDYIPYNSPPNTTAYTFTPNSSQLPSFFYYSVPDNGQYKNGITFQANTPWSAPFADGDKVDKTLNGTPNDGLEAAFNAYLCEYLEVYKGDLDHAKSPTGASVWDEQRWYAGLKSWHDYTASLRLLEPTESPAGMTVVRTSSTNNVVSWYAPYGATSYTLQRRSLSPLGNWTNVTGCDPLSTSCTDTASTGSQYAYRVQAANATGTNLSPWAQVAVFLSESGYDGYVSGIGGIYLPFPNVIQPGIQAGQGLGRDLLGFLSFDTTSLGSAATILDAKLRLKQSTNNDGFNALGACMADIQKGVFNATWRWRRSISPPVRRLSM